MRGPRGNERTFKLFVLDIFYQDGDARILGRPDGVGRERGTVRCAVVSCFIVGDGAEAFYTMGFHMELDGFRL